MSMTEDEWFGIVFPLWLIQAIVWGDHEERQHG